MKIRFITCLIFATVLASGFNASGAGSAQASDTVSVTTGVTDTIAADTVAPAKAKGKSLIRKIIDYFDDTNKPHPIKKLDISFIGGPHYSSDSGFGIGLVASGLYRNDLTDTIVPPSNLSIKLDATTKMFFTLGVDGVNIFARDRLRLYYQVSISSIATKFWGIGYWNNVNDANESDFKYIQSEAKVDFLWQLRKNIFLGPSISFDYIHGRKFEKPWLWQGEDARTFNLGVGATFQIDTRDNITAPTHGINIRLEQRFLPRWLLNRYAFNLTELSAAWYTPLWKDAVLATQIHGRFTYGNVPWGMLSSLGGSKNMRGYYEGRYRDKCESDVVVELRQHVWRRNSLVVWGGAGVVFPGFDRFRTRYILPNYGIGYRWEFKKYVNVRLDLGFGKHQTGFIFSINEAF